MTCSVESQFDAGKLLPRSNRKTARVSGPWAALRRWFAHCNLGATNVTESLFRVGRGISLSGRKGRLFLSGGDGSSRVAQFGSVRSARRAMASDNEFLPNSTLRDRSCSSISSLRAKGSAARRSRSARFPSMMRRMLSFTVHPPETFSRTMPIVLRDHGGPGWPPVCRR